jgi:hypothetical protein
MDELRKSIYYTNQGDVILCVGKLAEENSYGHWKNFLTMT